MLGEDRVWYVPKDDRQQMYYFENVTDGAELKLSDGRQYMRMGELQGFMHGEGELGYFALLDFCYNEGAPIAVDKLFDIEFIDKNGTRWVRTPDRSIDWGGMYTGELNNDNEVHFLKMMNSADPSDMRWFSFEFTISEDGTLSWSDEHYSFDMSVFSTEELFTSLSAESKADSDRRGHGIFDVRVKFLPVANSDSYYALRTMGNNNAQWYIDNEVFYCHDGGYELVTDKYKAVNAHSGNALYLLNSDWEGITLEIYNGTQLTDSVKVTDLDVDLRMAASSSVFSANPSYYLHVQYHNSDTMQGEIAIYDVSQGIKLMGVYKQDEVVYKDWGDEERFISFGIKSADGTTTVYGG